MRKQTLLTVILSIIGMTVAGITFTSCSKDKTSIEDNLLIGKWIFDKTISNSNIEIHNNRCNSKSDYIDFLSNGTLLEVVYNKNCNIDEENSYEWKKLSDSSLTLKYTDLVFNNETLDFDKKVNVKLYCKIKEITSNQLVLQFEKILINGQIPKEEGFQQIGTTVYYQRK